MKDANKKPDHLARSGLKLIRNKICDCIKLKSLLLFLLESF